MESPKKPEELPSSRRTNPEAINTENPDQCRPKNYSELERVNEIVDIQENGEREPKRLTNQRRRSLPASAFSESKSLMSLYSNTQLSSSREQSLEDLKHRLPKSFYQLKLNPMTTFEMRRFQELVDMANMADNDDRDPYAELRSCRYLRRRSDNDDQLDIDEIFKKD